MNRNGSYNVGITLAEIYENTMTRRSSAVWPAVSCVKKVGGAGSCNVPTDTINFNQSINQSIYLQKQAASETKVLRAGWQNSDGELQISTRGDYGCSKVSIFAPKFSQNVFLAPKFCISGRKFSDKKRFSDYFTIAQNWGRAAAPASPATTPLFASTVYPQSYALRP